MRRNGRNRDAHTTEGPDPPDANPQDDVEVRRSGDWFALVDDTGAWISAVPDTWAEVQR